MPWREIPLGELGADSRACIGGPFGSELTTKDYVEAPGVPVIRGSNLGQDGFIDHGFVYVSEEKARALQQNQARPGDITFTQRGTIGQVAIIPTSARYERYVLSQSQMRLTPDRSRVDPRFLVHYFRSPAVLSYLQHNTLATGVPHINLTILRRVPVPLPPLPEQRRIADILDKADSIRRKRKEAIALTEELLRSSFLEMFGDPVTNPKGWTSKPLQDLIDQDRGISYGVVQRGPEIENGVPVVRISNFGGNRFDGRDVVCTSHEISNAYRRTILRGGELVVSIRGTVGRVAVVPATASGWNVSREVAVIPLLPNVSRSLVHRALLSEPLQRFILGNVKGIAQSGINLADLRLAPIPTPDSSTLARFEGLVARTTDLEARLKEGAQDADVLFDSLVQRAFRGELIGGGRSNGKSQLGLFEGGGAAL